MEPNLIHDIPKLRSVTPRPAWDPPLQEGPGLGKGWEECHIHYPTPLKEQPQAGLASPASHLPAPHSLFSLPLPQGSHPMVFEAHITKWQNLNRTG